MAGSRASLQNLRVNPFSIVTDPQTEQIWVVLDCGFNPACASVLESVPQYLTRNPVDLVLEQRRQRSRLPLQDHLKDRRFCVPILGVSEFLTGGGEQVFEAPRRRLKAEVLNGIAAFGESAFGATNRGIKRIQSLFGTAGKEVAGRLETI
jgi:hypothetical protein